MSATTEGVPEEEARNRGRARAFLNCRAARLVLSLGMAASLAATLPATAAGTAYAAPVTANHHGGGGGGGNNHGTGVGNRGSGGPGWGLGGHRDRRVSVSGTVSNWSTGGFTLTSNSFTITVNVTDKTLYVEPGQTVPGQSSPGINGVMNGDHVTVTGAPSGPSTLKASVVKVPLDDYTGTVQDLSPPTFQLVVTAHLWGRSDESADGSWGRLPPRWGVVAPTTETSTATTIDVTTFTGTGATQYWEPGQSGAPGIGGLTNGDTVRVVGVQQGTDAMNALYVFVPLARVAGVVSSTSGTPVSSFVMKVDKWATDTVNVSSTTTKIRERGVPQPTISAGQYVQVRGVQDGAGVINALLIVIRPSGRGWEV